MPDSVRFGRYLLFERLARGGMAELYRAREADGDRDVAIKKILPHLSESPEFVEMFLDEARIARKLSHPGIVQVLDFGREGRDYFLALEYLRGRDAAALLKASAKAARPIPPAVAAAIGAQAAEALHYTHELRGEGKKPLGIIHRDVAPSNLFVTFGGEVKLLDFGIAVAAQRAQHTEPGLIKGRTPYLSPLRALGKPVDRREDVFGLGLSLFELLAGRPLFEVKTRNELLEAHKRRVPRLRSLRAEVPEMLETILHRACSLEAAGRFATALELQLALKRFLSQQRADPFDVVRDYISALFPEEARGSPLPPRPPAEGTVELSAASRAPPPSDRTLRVDPNAVTDTALTMDVHGGASREDPTDASEAIRPTIEDRPSVRKEDPFRKTEKIVSLGKTDRLRRLAPIAGVGALALLFAGALFVRC